MDKFFKCFGFNFVSRVTLISVFSLVSLNQLLIQ